MTRKPQNIAQAWWWAFGDRAEPKGAHMTAEPPADIDDAKRIAHERVCAAHEQTLRNMRAVEHELDRLGEALPGTPLWQRAKQAVDSLLTAENSLRAAHDASGPEVVQYIVSAYFADPQPVVKLHAEPTDATLRI
jgi:hypothetical protein